ncbi:MAG TPA: hypothetical protein DEB09_02370 [Candidatus Magasanikbacteria bacterium]|nr:hypothetical protein [Candidatus Magasanikbacteria bacterium]
MFYQTAYKSSNRKTTNSDPRLKIMWVLFVLLAVVVVGRLFMLMIWENNFYLALAAGSHDMYNKLFPKRGSVYIQDSRTKEEYPLAINRDYFLVYADTRKIKTNEEANLVLQKLAEVFNYDDAKKLKILTQLNKRTDPYEPIENKIDEMTMQKITTLNLVGIDFVRQPFRFYPEGNLAAPVIGFLGKDKDGNNIGHYGIEGYWQKELAGKGGFVQGAKSAVGAFIPLADRYLKASEDGADLLLTIDRTIQYKACERLEAYRQEFGAKTASLILIDPYNGAIRTMCSLPDFDPNNYGQVENADVYNNSNIFTPYEPGSVFKPILMAAAINEGLVSPNTTFFDSGSRAGLCQTPIRNADDKSYQTQSMIGVLENSVNTGMVFVAEQLGKKREIKYLEDFGFGFQSGLELDSEVGGNISTLKENKGDKIDCYGATASFGQGITATPLQLVSAFSAIVNGGKLYKPYIVEEVRMADGTIEKRNPKETRTVLNNQTSVLLLGMLTSVVENGHAKRAGVPGYYVGGKTGTAQIPGPGGYTAETIQTFIGVFPSDNPKFVMLIKFEKPARTWADSTTAPAFGEIAKFILQYYQVPPNR